MKPEVKTLFDRACDTLGVTPETRDMRWRMLRDLSLTANDELLISLVASGRMEELVTQFARSAASIDGMPAAVGAAVRKAAQEAVGPVASAATKQVEAAHAKATSSLGPAIATAATTYLDRELARRRFTVSAAMAMCAIVLALMVGYAGYGMGTLYQGNVRSKAEALAQRGDFETLWTIAQGNADLSATLATYCASGSGRVVVTNDGLSNCNVSLWIDGRGMVIPPTNWKGNPIFSMWASGSMFLNQYRPMTLAVSFFALGLFAPWAVRFVRTKPAKTAGTI